MATRSLSFLFLKPREEDEDSWRSGRISHELRSLSTICEENRIPARLQRYQPTQLIVVYAWKLFCDQLRKITPNVGLVRRRRGPHRGLP